MNRAKGRRLAGTRQAPGVPAGRKSTKAELRHHLHCACPGFGDRAAARDVPHPDVVANLDGDADDLESAADEEPDVRAC